MMNLTTVFLLASTALSATFALKSPSRCANGQGNTFVCNVVEAFKNGNLVQPEEVKNSNFTFAINGQADFFDVLKHLIELSEALRHETSKQSSQNKQMSRFLRKSTTEFGRLNLKSTDLQHKAFMAVSRIESAFASYRKTHSNRVIEVEEKANSFEDKSDRQRLRSLLYKHVDELKRCSVVVANELEALQNNTKQTGIGYYDTLIDLVDEIGRCVEESNPSGNCPSRGDKMLALLNVFSGKFSLAGAKFNALEQRGLYGHPCIRMAIQKFDFHVRNIVQSAKTTMGTSSTAFTPPESTTDTEFALCTSTPTPTDPLPYSDDSSISE